jgi:hypothetical protein
MAPVRQPSAGLWCWLTVSINVMQDFAGDSGVVAIGAIVGQFGNEQLTLPSSLCNVDHSEIIVPQTMHGRVLVSAAV